MTSWNFFLHTLIIKWYQIMRVCIYTYDYDIIWLHTVEKEVLHSNTGKCLPLGLCKGTGPLWGESISHWQISLTKASDAKLWCFLWSAPEQTVKQTIEVPVILDAIMLIMTSLLRHNWTKILQTILNIIYQYCILNVNDTLHLKLDAMQYIQEYTKFHTTEQRFCKLY